MSAIEHVFMGVNYETDVKDGTYFALLGGVPVTGTHSRSRGEAHIKFQLMLESMQDQESKPMQPGDLLSTARGLFIIEFVNWIMYPEGVTDQDVKEGEPQTIPAIMVRVGEGKNFRGRASTMNSQDPVVSLSGGNFETIPKAPRYEWQGTEEIEFWSWKGLPGAGGDFTYKREVNIWSAVWDEVQT